jgi:MFS family permease
MTGTPGEGDRQKHDPLAALRQPRFVLYTFSRIFSTIGNAALQAILLWHVYELTDSPVSLGILGLVRFLPSLGLSMIGGAAADTYNRRTIITISQTFPFVAGIVLSAATLNDWITVELIYGLVLVIGLASSFENPARQALLPAIVRPETFANAVTVSSTLQSLGMVTGSLVGGVLVYQNVGASYVVYTCLLAGAMVTMAMLSYEHDTSGPKRSVSVAAIKEGIGFVRGNQVILGAMTLDMFAVIFGGAKGLLPVYAKDILDAGGFGYGLLLASLEIGASLMALALVVRPPIYRTGKALVYSVAVFGILTAIFGLSRNLYLSILVYMAIGAADEVSVVMRNVIIQLATPDALRGRVSSVNQVFIQASNQLGAMESGFLAALTSATFAVVSGGVAAVGVAGVIGWRMRELYNYVTPAHSHAVSHGPPPPPPAVAAVAEAEEEHVAASG